MTSEPRAALDRLVAALEAHLAAAERRHGEADPAVVAAYQTLADAFEAYDEALYDAFDEVTPFVLYDDAEDAAEDAFDDEDLDEEGDEDYDDEIDDLDVDDEPDDVDDEGDDDLDDFEDVDEEPDEDAEDRPKRGATGNGADINLDSEAPDRVR